MAKNTLDIQNLIYGGNRWQKYGKDRIYFDGYKSYFDLLTGDWNLAEGEDEEEIISHATQIATKKKAEEAQLVALTRYDEKELDRTKYKLVCTIKNIFSELDEADAVYCEVLYVAPLNFKHPKYWDVEQT